jgi:hypothetical protein
MAEEFDIRKRRGIRKQGGSASAQGRLNKRQAEREARQRERREGKGTPSGLTAAQLLAMASDAEVNSRLAAAAEHGPGYEADLLSGLSYVEIYSKFYHGGDMPWDLFPHEAFVDEYRRVLRSFYDPIEHNSFVSNNVQASMAGTRNIPGKNPFLMSLLSDLFGTPTAIAERVIFLAKRHGYSASDMEFLLTIKVALSGLNLMILPSLERLMLIAHFALRTELVRRAQIAIKCMQLRFEDIEDFMKLISRLDRVNALLRNNRFILECYRNVRADPDLPQTEEGYAHSSHVIITTRYPDCMRFTDESELERGFYIINMGPLQTMGVVNSGWYRRNSVLGPVHAKEFILAREEHSIEEFRNGYVQRRIRKTHIHARDDTPKLDVRKTPVQGSRISIFKCELSFIWPMTKMCAGGRLLTKVDFEGGEITFSRERTGQLSVNQKLREFVLGRPPRTFTPEFVKVYGRMVETPWTEAQISAEIGLILNELGYTEAMSRSEKYALVSIFLVYGNVAEARRYFELLSERGQLVGLSFTRDAIEIARTLTFR